MVNSKVVILNKGTFPTDMCYNKFVLWQDIPKKVTRIT